ncbi:MAG: fibrobacter succinogenes major paralogous domain-containing protein [Candidatus Symbiothrix sp.]|jgi:hypothetical protein|nr:fibrobacter succinogenes major paralogous domain-containing protein [Candidatus Symbiothrix sp.]
MKKRILFRELRVSTTLDRKSIKSAMTLLVTAFLVTGNCSPVTAQVAIGGDGTVTPGALLDLSQATDAGGLLLPQIVSADTLTAVLRKPGMLVYNKTDGKIYVYNGSAWSAGGGSGGSGGGGGEPEPTPSPTSCSGSVMGVSGTLYPIGSYPYAQNDLKNLCWTLSNLREAGASYASYPNESDVRGYYYAKSVATDPANDICVQNLGSRWRVPNAADWGLLKAGFEDLIAAESQNWIGEPNALNGYVGRVDYCTVKVSGVGWGSMSTFIIRASPYAAVLLPDGSITLNTLANIKRTQGGNCGGTYIGTYLEDFFHSVRCVRDL